MPESNPEHSIPPPTESPVSPPPSSPPPAPRPRGGGAKSLFSDHYLRHRLPEHPEWGEDVGEPLAALRALYEGKRGILPNLNEAQTEAEFIRPALEILGFAYIPQASVRRAGRPLRPDYALFADETAKEETYALRGSEPAFYARALAVADAKYWERPLSEVRRDDARDEFRNTNPSFQIVNYLIGTGVDWGILTNGRTWRLYYRQASSTAHEFYEVDLVEAQADEDAFKRFWLFFRCDAFTPDAQGNTFLDRVRAGSDTYARVIGDRLKDLVFGEVFPLLAGGFVAYRQTELGQDATSEAARHEIYQATLSLLYKLLFLLYAEARDLLPVANAGYQQKSVTRMAREVARRMNTQEPLGTTSTELYDRLLDLFRVIDRGDKGLALPRYNGGLFSARNRANQFLARHKLADAVLAPALDKLARADGEPIDYGFIGVRHLGAIYEGLLEHRLTVDDPARGQVHLETDKGERKATGSYYTPDYIVKYIVAHTLGSIIEERAARFDELMERIAELRAELARNAAAVPAGRQELERLEHQARETLLDIKVCDPAMGSGHFLVEAVDLLTDRLIDVLNQYPEHNPVLSMLDRIRASIVAEMERQGIAVDPRRLDDTQLLTRVVMKRCIYGVDLNEMAVELAKVSLWLHTFTVGAPLSFLDHHLRWGNSLIGATVREAEAEMAKPDASGQLTFLTGPFVGVLRAAEIMRGISVLSDATFAELEESERLFRQFDEAAKPYKRLLDIYVARHFGVKQADEFLRLWGTDAIAAVKAGPESVDEPWDTVVREARRLYEEKRFFHWDLEFPEVFIDLGRAMWNENPGFDAVVGNPPYGLIDALPWFPSLYNDAFVYFWKLGVDKSKSGGYLSLITPAAWLTGLNYQSMRQILLEGTQILRVVGLPYDVFPGAYIDTCVAVVEAGQPTTQPVLVKQMGKHDDATRVAQLDYDVVRADLWRGDPYNKLVLIPAVAELQRFRDLQGFVDLGQIIRVERGVQPYSRSKHTEEQIRRDFLRLHHPPPEHQRDVYYPELLGEELSRYHIDPVKRGWLKYSDELASKRDEAFFTRSRVVLRRLLSRRRELMAAITSERLITTDNILNILVEADEISEGYIAALLNSKLVAWIYTNTSTISVKDDFPQVTYEELKSLPIPRIFFTTPKRARSRLAKEGIAQAAAWVQDADPVQPVSYRAFLRAEPGKWVTARLKADPEQSDVIHDLLAHLAEQMIAMNKDKQAEVKGFFSWLEAFLGCPVDDLSGKTYVRIYPERTFDELLTTLKKNRRRIQPDLDRRGPLESLRAEWEASTGKLRPLLARLAATDRLIDLVVYRLYGLTEDEVAVVEGAAP